MWYNTCMKRFFLILTFFLIFINPSLAENTVKKEFVVKAADGFAIKADLEYPKIKGQKEFSTVVLLHSLGYSSQWWEDLPASLNQNGYAVLKIDLRGHGKSVYNSNLKRVSWKGMTNSAFAKYPDDVISVINQVKEEYAKTEFFNKWALVGSDIGGSAAILASEKLPFKPKTIVMLSPVINTRGLYLPVKVAHLSDVDIFSISGTNDFTGKDAENYLKKFAQATFVTYTSEAKSTGMLMLKNDRVLTKIITSWLKEYL